MEKFRFNQSTVRLFEAILALKTIKEAGAFFRDLWTIDEIKEFTERWAIVQLLDKNWPYRKIAKKLKVSTTTVSRVAMWLHNGMGGYGLILSRLNKHHHNSSPIGKELC